MPTAQIGAEAVPQLRSRENQFLRPNRNFHEIGCPRPKSVQKPSPSSDHEKINFYGRIANFMKLGAHGPNQKPSPRSRENQFLRPNRNFHEIGCPRPKSVQKPSPSSDHEKINFYGRIAIFMKLGAHGPNRCRSRPPAQIRENRCNFMKLGAHGPNRCRSRPPAQITRKSIFTAEIMRKSIFTAESQ